MSDEDTIILSLVVITFIAGLLLIASGFADLGSALSLDSVLEDPVGTLTKGGTGGLKVTVGVVLVIAIIVPGALKVIFRR